MIKYFDKENRRLVAMGESATSDFWTQHWLEKRDFANRVKMGASRGMIKKYTLMFLKPPAKVIDAGCGIGQNVFGLSQWGYDAYGVDFAGDVVKKTKDNFPEMKIYTQDVRKLEFPDNFFDGYWSLGVIEHFKDGYDDILKEAHRVLKNGGHLFITVPWLSPLRRIKAKLGMYSVLEKDTNMSNFYEFMLHDQEVIRKLEKEGWCFVFSSPYDAVKGLKDELTWIRPIFQRIYDGQNIFAKGARFLFTLTLAAFAGHIILLVFKKP